MKSIKAVSILFLVTCAMSMLNVKADSYLGFSSVTIPALKGVYTSSSVDKTTYSEQYVKSSGAYDKISGDARIIEARLKGVSSSYTELSVGTYKQLDSGSTSLGVAPGSFQLQLRAQKSTVSQATFSGTWILDDYLK